MNSKAIILTLSFALAFLYLSVAGHSSISSRSSLNPDPVPGAENGNVNVMVTDASNEDWAVVGIKILSISLVPQGGGSNVTIYSAAESSSPILNLVQLDQIRELLGSVAVPAGAYTGAAVTVSGNPADIQLTSAAFPSPDYTGPAGAQIPSSQIEEQGASTAAGTRIVPATVNFNSPFVVTANKTVSLDLEFDLSDPNIIVGKTQGKSMVWTVDIAHMHQFSVPDITHVLLRDIYGDVSSSAAGGDALTIQKVLPAEPAAATAAAETAVASTYNLKILPDTTNGVSYYDADATSSPVVIKSFADLAKTLRGKYVRVAARFQQDGTLIAVRIWSSKTFGTLYAGPEGHIVRLSKMRGTITVEDEIGQAVPIVVNASTQFYLRTPWSAIEDAKVAATGPEFLKYLDEGFKVHASVADLQANPLVAQTITIETQNQFGTPASGGPWLHRTAPSQQVEDGWTAVALRKTPCAIPNNSIANRPCND